MTTEAVIKEEEKMVCGVVMPISTIDGCSESHWEEVFSILSEAIESAGFSAQIVSNADEVGIIQSRIIQNLYDNPIVVCDVSGKNPNVMFELGMRLAFDKPTIIIKDDCTSYSFDTSPIEHLEYPRDLRFSKIVSFKSKLSSKIKATYEKSVSNKDYTTFLKHFGEFKIAKIEKQEISSQEFIVNQLKNLSESMKYLDKKFSSYQRSNYQKSNYSILHSKLNFNDSDDRLVRLDYCLGDNTDEEISDIFKATIEMGPEIDVGIKERNGHYHIQVHAPMHTKNISNIRSYLAGVSRGVPHLKTI